MLTCDVCGFDFWKEEHHDFVIDGCSDFCANTSPEEKLAFKNLKTGEWGVWPCSECGCAIEDEYMTGGHCTKCGDKIELRTLREKVRSLTKENEELRLKLEFVLECS